MGIAYTCIKSCKSEKNQVIVTEYDSEHILDHTSHKAYTNYESCENIFLAGNIILLEEIIDL